MSTKTGERHFNENGRGIWNTIKRVWSRCRREKKLLYKGKIPKEREWVLILITSIRKNKSSGDTLDQKQRIRSVSTRKAQSVYSF